MQAVLSHEDAETQGERQSILDLISDAARSHPKQGWDVVADKTGFTRKAMEITGDAENFVEALARVGLTRFEAVEAFRKAKQVTAVPTQRKGNKRNAYPVVAKPEPNAQPGNVVPAEPERSPSLRQRGQMQIGRVTEPQWQRLSKSQPEILVYGGRYIARPSQSR